MSSLCSVCVSVYTLPVTVRLKTNVQQSKLKHSRSRSLYFSDSSYHCRPNIVDTQCMAAKTCGKPNTPASAEYNIRAGTSSKIGLEYAESETFEYFVAF